MAFTHKHTRDEEWRLNCGAKFGVKYQIFTLKSKGRIALVNTSYEDAKLIKNAPKLLQIAEMFYDYLGTKDSLAKDIVGKVLKDIGVFQDEEVADKEMEEARVAYNVELISNFMECYKEETGKKIPEKVFDKFFNV